MDKFWLKSYPEGIPAEIDPARYGSLVELLDESFQKYADRNACVCMDKSLSYREVDRLSTEVGRCKVMPAAWRNTSLNCTACGSE